MADNPFKEENPFASGPQGFETGQGGGYVPPVSGSAATTGADQINIDVNPFLDPTQTGGVAGTSSSTKASNGAAGGGRGLFGGAASSSPAPAATIGPAFGGAYSNTDPREEALSKKERELARREQELREKEAELARRFPNSNKNWPSCYPIVYHDIDADVPAPAQPMVRQVYYTWLGLFICLSYNVICVTLACFSVGVKVVTGWLMAIIYFVLGVPLSLYLWYFRCYRAGKTDKAFTYLVFFCMYFLHICFCIYAALGFYPKWAFAGIANFGEAYEENTFTGAIYTIGFCLWTIEAVASLSCLRFTMKAFRNSGKADELPKSKNDLIVQATQEAMT